MGKKAPKAPNPADAINAQAEANRINQYGPTGSLQFGSVDANGNFVAAPGKQASQTTLDPLIEALGRQYLGGQSFNPQELQFRIPNAQDINRNLPSSISASSLKPGQLDQNFSSGSIASRLPGGADSANLTNYRNINAIEGGLPDVSMDFSGDALRTGEAVFNQGYGRLQPLFEQQNRRTENMLVNRGLPVGGEASTNELDRVSRGQGQQLNDLLMSSILAGNDQASRLFQQSQQARQGEFGIQSGLAGLAGQQRGQQFGETEAQRAARLNEGLSLGGLNLQGNAQTFGQEMAQAQLAEQQRQNEVANRNAAFQASLAKQLGIANLGNQQAQIGANLLGTTPGQPVQPIDVTGPMNAQFAGQLAQNQNNVNGLQNLATLGILAGPSLFGGAAAAGGTGALLSGVGGLFAELSDRRLKENIVKVGERDGINIYEFSYNFMPGRFRGVMADEVEHMPDVVSEVAGYKAVDYSKLPVAFEAI